MRISDRQAGAIEIRLNRETLKSVLKDSLGRAGFLWAVRYQREVDSGIEDIILALEAASIDQARRS